MANKKTTHVSDAEEFSKKNSSASETKKIRSHVSEEKKKNVAELKELIKNKNTILLASIKNLPGSQFQEIIKKLRGKAVIKVPKKNLILRALDESDNREIEKIKERIGNSVAILFSDLDAFELASELLKNKSPAKAKAGQEAPEDIEIPEGPTDLVPGPAISELGALGIKIQIEKGKINIKEPEVIVRKGEKISHQAADIMSKLDIKPFSIGFVPLCAFDNKEKKVYLDIKIDREATLKELKEAYSKALPFAVEIGYPAKETITFLIGKAGRHEKVLEKIAEKEKNAEAGASEDRSDNNKTKEQRGKSRLSSKENSERVIASEGKNNQTQSENKPDREEN